MNKRKILATSLLLVIVLFLVFSQKIFDKNFKEVALLDNNMSEFKEYYNDASTMQFNIPQEWQVNEDKTNDYITCKSDFKDDINKVWGFVEIINTSEDIKTLAQKDIDNLPLYYADEKIDNFKLEKIRGIKSSYNTETKKGKQCINNVYYFKINDKSIGRITFVVPKDNYKDSLNSIFDMVVSSFKTGNNNDLLFSVESIII